jgi:signal transduction histidine kinase
MSEKLNDVVIDVDVKKISQVIRNLVSNALKFTRNCGVVRITAKYKAGDISKKGVLRVEVNDTGCGISPVMTH